MANGEGRRKSTVASRSMQSNTLPRRAPREAPFGGQRPRRQGDGVTTVGRSGASDSRKDDDDDDDDDDDFQDDLPVEEVRPPSRAEELEDAAIMAEVAALEATAAAAVEAVFISEHAKSAPTGGDSVEVGARGNWR